MNNIPNNTSFDADAALAQVKAGIEAIAGDRDDYPQFDPKPAPDLSGRVPPPATQRSDLEKLNATTEKLFADRRRQLLELESRHALDRARLEDSYRMSMAELEHEAREAVRALDRSFEAERKPIADLVRRLEDMRE